MTIEQAAQEFCNYSKVIRGYASKTIKRYRQSVNFYCKYANVTEFKDVSEKNVRQLFYYGRTERAWGVNTFLHYQKSLLVFFRWCKEQGYLDTNPILSMEVPKKERTLPPKLTKQDAQLLLEIAYNYPYKYRFLRNRNHAIFAMFLFAGLRKSELLNLKYADVDVENFSILVRKGKGNKDRFVPMSQQLADSLQRYIQERNRSGKTCPSFFTSSNRNLGFTETGLNHLIDKIRKASNVRFTAHKLRHTFATLMPEGGCDIFSLSKMMGHSDIKTTTIYLAASAEHLRAQMGKHPLNTE